MPTFPTPAPIDLAVNVQSGQIEVVAGERTETVVTVSPGNPAKAASRRRALETTVELVGTRLAITGPRPRYVWIGPGPDDSVDVRVELPSGSRFTGEIALGTVRTVGVLGATRIKSSMGEVEVDSTGDLWVRAGHGGVTVDSVEGTAAVTADHGQIRLGTVAGDASLKASHGSIQVGRSGGDLEAKLSYGDLEITTALASVAAKTAYGSVRLHEVSSGSIEVESGFGGVAIGVRPGVPAWLDLSSKTGRVRNELDGAAAPHASEQAVAVRARTQAGDITVRHAR